MKLSFVVAMLLVTGCGGSKDDKPATKKPVETATEAPKKPKPTAQQCEQLKARPKFRAIAVRSTMSMLVDTGDLFQRSYEDLVKKPSAPATAGLDASKALKAAATTAQAAWDACSKALDDKPKDAGAPCKTAQDTLMPAGTAYTAFQTAVAASPVPDPSTMKLATSADAALLRLPDGKIADDLADAADCP